MRNCTAAIAFITLVSLPASASAQAPRIAPRPSVVFAPSTLPVATRPANLPETHWKTGAIVGGVGLGVLGAFAMQGICTEDQDNCAGAAVGGFLIGGLIGGVTGALIGGQFPKGAPAEQP